MKNIIILTSFTAKIRLSNISTLSLKNKVLVLVITFLTPFILNGQKAEKHFFEKSKIGFTPSSFFNEFVGVQFNYTYGISKKIDFNTELGYIFRGDAFKILFPDYPSTGFRFRLEPRFRLNNIEKNHIFYISGLVQYRYTNTLTTRYPFFSIVTPVITPSQEKINMFSIGSKIGFITNLSKNFYIHFAIGLGVNSINFSSSDNNQSTRQVEENAKDKTQLVILHGNFLYAF